MDSSEPVLNFLGRSEFMAKPLFRTSIFRTPTSGTVTSWDLVPVDRTQVISSRN